MAISAILQRSIITAITPWYFQREVPLNAPGRDSARFMVLVDSSPESAWAASANEETAIGVCEGDEAPAGCSEGSESDEDGSNED
eukprot:CAMPEP_0174903496 /NCGR_PEP_ID=MMETSP0167-20121228/44024_1 /TAXON_ID=38298 /ORGANISM="Rhodella maculata, Strain CCMP736" /LENGTH=84 /DNA_ID=CAMNT_0016145835 /DNA_START=55 /DNA_END=307 /DNA_ORIENTATION=+